MNLHLQWKEFVMYKVNLKDKERIWSNSTTKPFVEFQNLPNDRDVQNQKLYVG